MMNRYTTRLLWAVYISLLATLLPHTAWAFAAFEPAGSIGQIVAWCGAFSFEAAIAVLTHKLAQHIEQSPRRGSAWVRFRARYINAYSLGLICALLVSALANLAHAVQFGGELAIFARFGIPFGVYALAFGGVLPFVSLLFARVLSNVAEEESAENAPNPELESAKEKLRQMRVQLGEAEARATTAEARFGAVGDLAVQLFAAEKRARILAAAHKWPELPAASIAIVAGASPSYVSEVLTAENAR